MRNSSSSATGLGDFAIFGLFTALSIIVGVFVVTVLMVIASPIVDIFPVDSGAQEIVLGISLMWGVVAGCVTAVFTIGSYRRIHVAGQTENLNEAESVPLEMIGRPIGARRPANDRRTRAPARKRAAAPVVYEDDEDADELLLEEEDAPRRRAGGQRYRRG